VKRDRRNGSSVCLDPLSKSITHTPRIDVYDVWEYERVWVTRVNSTNVLDEGLRIREIGHRMNSKVKSVKQGVYRK
jgi:hypothetical protein